MEEHETEVAGIHWSYRVTQALFTVTAIGCFLIFWYVGTLLRVPAEYRHGGSLVRQPSMGGTLMSVLSAGVLLAGCTLLATALLRDRWFLASLTAATVGFSAWSMRGGPMHEVLLYAPTTAVFFQLAVEVVLLGAMVGAIWLFLSRGSIGAANEGAGSIIIAVLLQTLVMTLVVLILVQTDAKKQCVMAVFVAGLVGSSVIHSNSPSPEAGRWYWIAPVLVGVLGYFLAAIQSHGWTDGSRELDGFFAPLARPLPLDYASAGMFGSLLGYWMSMPASDEATEIADHTMHSDSNASA